MRIADPSLTSQNFFHLTGQRLSMPGKRQRPCRSIQNTHLMGTDYFRPQEPILDGPQAVEVAEGFQLENIIKNIIMLTTPRSTRGPYIEIGRLTSDERRDTK